MKARISILDGFRSLAIISVILYHYFSRWTPPKNKVSLYPYGDAYNYFSHGNLGVQFFFIISGFVIFFTLEATPGFADFWKKRLIRLLPSIFFASLITFVVFALLDTHRLFPASHRLINFIPSLTFISPNIFKNLGLGWNYLNGSYWSLWPEIQFYLYVSTIYYLGRHRFVRNFSILSLVLIGFSYLMKNIQSSNKLHIQLPAGLLRQYIRWVQDGFNLLEFLPFFALGVLFYVLFRNRQAQQPTPRYVWVLLTVLSLFTIYAGIETSIRLAYVLMIALFLAFIYLPRALRLFEQPAVVAVGQSSYFLYLIHEHIGILLIYTFGRYLLPYGFVLPLGILLVLIWVSILFTNRVDKRINRWLRTRIAG